MTYSPYSGSLSLRLRNFYPLASPQNATRRFILQKTRRRTLVLRHLVSPRFQVLFHSPSGVLFAFPSRYSFAIGSCSVFSLGSWSTRIRAGFLVPRPTQVPHHRASLTFAYGTFTLFGRSFHSVLLAASFFLLCGSSPCGPTTPLIAVWAPPLSLAATHGISVDFFSRVT